jgi:hypothetical protein
MPEVSVTGVVMTGTAVLVRQVVWSSFGSYYLEEVIWFLFKRILGIVVLTERVAAPGGSSSMS